MKLVTLTAVTLSTASFVLGHDDNFPKLKNLKNYHHDNSIPEKRSSMRDHKFEDCAYYDSECDSDYDSDYGDEPPYCRPSHQMSSHDRISHRRSQSSDYGDKHNEESDIESKKCDSKYKKYPKFQKSRGNHEDKRHNKNKMHYKESGKKQHTKDNVQDLPATAISADTFGSVYFDFFDAIFGQRKSIDHSERHLLNEDEYANGASIMVPNKVAISGIAAIGAMMLL